MRTFFVPMKCQDSAGSWQDSRLLRGFPDILIQSSYHRFHRLSWRRLLLRLELDGLDLESLKFDVEEGFFVSALFLHSILSGRLFPSKEAKKSSFFLGLPWEVG